MRRLAGAAMIEFAIAWPLALLVVMTSVEAAVWSAEAYAARAASLAGARAGAVVGGSAAVASDVAVRVLAASVIGAAPSAWCPGSSSAQPQVWVCATDLGRAIKVQVGGSAPALVPLGPAAGLPLNAEVVLQKQTYTT